MDPMPPNSRPPGDVPMTTMHVRRAVGGDSDSLEWLVARLTPLLLAHASYRMGDVLRRHHDPEDLVDDAWLVALPRLSRLTARDGRLTPVLLRFLTTTLLNQIRNLARKHLRGESSSGRGIQPGPEVDNIASDQSSIVSRTVRGELVSEIQDRLNALSEDDRRVILLRGVEQQSNATVGQLLELEPGTVSKRYHRALERLRAGLRNSVFDELD